MASISDGSRSLPGVVHAAVALEACVDASSLPALPLVLPLPVTSLPLALLASHLPLFLPVPAFTPAANSGSTICTKRAEHGGGTNGSSIGLSEPGGVTLVSLVGSKTSRSCSVSSMPRASTSCTHQLVPPNRTKSEHPQRSASAAIQRTATATSLSPSAFLKACTCTRWAVGRGRWRWAVGGGPWAAGRAPWAVGGGRGPWAHPSLTWSEFSTKKCMFLWAPMYASSHAWVAFSKRGRSVAGFSNGPPTTGSASRAAALRSPATSAAVASLHALKRAATSSTVCRGLGRGSRHFAMRHFVIPPLMLARPVKPTAPSTFIAITAVAAVRRSGGQIGTLKRWVKDR
mmetsp:Transcript_64428/g.178538  ORF Transcript_64428/g.178538 Transcript_64428/m.178538 type:complete len:344 (+) Transcript_64428:692-1723(+)